MRVQSLLNPALDFIQSPYTSTISTSSTPERMSSATPTDSQSSNSPTPPSPGPLRRRSLVTTWDHPGNYQPHEGEPENAELADQMKAKQKQFNIKPLGQIARSTKHIPYTSDKRTLTAKTGLEALDVFRYTFDSNGESWGVMWDCNVGLVRITPFFKALGLVKTAPAKSLDRNPGLRDITYSITGGAIIAQGYWMPFEAARAVCTTFCYHIRWALTPIFGYNFPAECLHPGHPDFGNYKIPRDIIRDCTQRMNQLRRGAPSTKIPEETDCTSAQASDDSESTMNSRIASPAPPRRLRSQKKRTYKQLSDTDADIDTDSDRETNYRETPQRRSSSPVSPKTQLVRAFTPINARAKKAPAPTSAPRSMPATPFDRPVSAEIVPPPSRGQQGGRYFKKRKRADAGLQETSSPPPKAEEHTKKAIGDEELQAAETLLSLGGNQTWASSLDSSEKREV
ncbi:MAG: hypothetical protein Q9157_004038 [Trypethelium eluteriae]